MISHTESFDDSKPAAVTARVHGCSGTIVIDHQGRCNAIRRSMLGQLRQAFDDLHQEKKVRAVILTGAGKAFSAGTDLHEIDAAMNDSDAQSLWMSDCLAQKELIECMLRFPKPIIAAVNGPALGLGASLVLASDFAVGTESARFGFPETKWGLVAGMAAPLLAFRLGAWTAADFLLRGQLIDGAACQQLGIYGWVVSEELVWAKADALARELSRSAPEAVAMSKRLLNETIGEQLLTHLSSGAATTATARTTAAAMEGVKAFVQKREPEWK